MSKVVKTRVDQLLVERGLAESRTRAQALVLAGTVFSGETRLAKPGQTLLADAPLDVRGRDHPWVSRGGIKLAHALKAFGLDPRGVTAMDIGSSTGGFTDVLLSLGAARVFAVDSGTNQLAWKLRQDSRVTVLEQTSARVLTPAQIDAPCNWVVCDASFISLAKALGAALALIYQTMAAGWGAVRRTGLESKAVAAAMSRLEAAGRETALAEGSTAGTQDGLDWRVDVTRYAQPGLVVTTPQLAAWWVKVEIVWRETPASPRRSVALTTLKLAGAPP